MLRCSPPFSLANVVSAPTRGEGSSEHGIKGIPDLDLPGAKRTEPGAFRLSSLSFEDGGMLPERLARKPGVSPQLSWDNAPEGTYQFVIIMDDPDAESAVGYTFVHWIARVPSKIASLDEGASSGGWTGQPKTLTGSSTSTAYKGPLPPSGTHHYHIKIYALADSFRHDDFDNLASSTTAADTKTYTRRQFEAMFKVHILESAEISGSYSAPTTSAH